MSCYNESNRIEKSINSVLNQTYKNFEFIIINDCSTDQTDKLIKKIQLNDKRIIIINNNVNLGLTKSLNKGIGLCKGKYIARIDPDDNIYNNRLKKQLNFLEQNPDYSMVGAQRLIIDKINNNKWKDRLPTSSNDIKKNAIIRNPFFHSLVMIRKKTLVDVGCYDESFRYVQDYELWSRVIYQYRTANLEEVLGEKIIRKDAISFRDDISRERSYLSFLATFYHFRRGSFNFFYLVYLIKPLYRFFKNFIFSKSKNFA